ncbi:hypothetical protein V2J09_019122 [Rumex salicifolius]
MGNPFKDALKTICGINQWSYGVFWKIGCQNPKLVGRTAFAGKYEWIVSGSFNEMVYPPEVLSELHQQFSAGMQTIAVIPVMPHGVIQLGSSMAMMENVRFIQDVETLIQRIVSEPFEEFGSPFSGMKSVSTDPYVNMENFSTDVAFNGGKWQQSTIAESGSRHGFETQVTNKAVSLAPDVLLKQLSSSYDLHSESNHHQEHTYDNQFSSEDLFDALGFDFKNKILNGSTYKLSEDASDTANRMSESGLLTSCGSDNLLDAVVNGAKSSATQSSSDSLSCRTTLTKASYGVCQMDELFAQSRPSMEVGPSSNTSAFVKNAQTKSYTGSHVSSWVNQGPSIVTAESKKCNQVGKPVNKKVKAGQNLKPRPKDRQLIQDRLKELREIIPNGAKCSIDVLLEQTIKHMVFLQSVNKHADKLSQTVESKIIDKDDGLVLKDKFEGGVTWAYEVGYQAKICPIIVEDLHSPHQFIVEGFFLEIADVIRGMGLTILKGVIQKRSDKIWAHFAVEAKRQMTRVEIFLSLVHLMEQNKNIAVNEGFDYSTFVHPTNICVGKLNIYGPGSVVTDRPGEGPGPVGEGGPGTEKGGNGVTPRGLLVAAYWLTFIVGGGHAT